MIDNYIKFSFIVLCFIIALLSYWFCRSKKDWLYLAAAMGFTLISDFFLVIMANHRMGVLTFCFVHIIYILRVSNDKEKSISQITSVICGGGLLFIAFTFVPFLSPSPLDPLIIFAIVYGSLFVLNLITHIGYYRRGGANRHIILAGLILFALCDIHVLMFNLPNYLLVPPEISLWGRTWMWAFYAPSQLLLGISAVDWSDCQRLEV